MADDLRDRVLAAVRKGLAGPLATSKTKNRVLQGYSSDSATENGVTVQAICNTAFANEIKDVTPLHPFFAKGDSQPGKEPAEPSLAYQAVSAEPDGTLCKVTIVEIPTTGLRYRRVFGVLQVRCPALVPLKRWRLAVEDGRAFLHRWGSQAESLKWDSRDLFGLHTPPAKPHPSYNRLSRYDCTGLIWLLEGRRVLALTADTAAIENPATGSITTYRRYNKPALGPVGDNLEDLTCPMTY
jgi:hypothetical protein